MEKKKVFIKRYPSKGEFPKVSKKYFTSHGYSDYSAKRNEWSDGDWVDISVEWFLVEVELPREEDLQDIAINTTPFRTSFMAGANFILNHLKSNTNGN